MNALLEEQSGILSIFQNKTAEQIASYKAWFNDPTREIGMKFKSIDIKQRTALLELTV